MKPQRWDRETVLLTAVTGCVSVFAFLFYLRHGWVLLYGDAVAHITIARRVFDSRTPGLLQLGTVWLPLPHLLMMPFLLSNAAWRTGVGGSVSSMVAYVTGTAGIFRLVRGALSSPAEPDVAVRLVAWLAALIYAANPNLIYLQTTAMTESLYLALFVWAVVHFSEYLQMRRSADIELQQPASQSLVKCGLCLAGGELTRYDGWFAALVFVSVLLGAEFGEGHLNFRIRTYPSWSDLKKFVLITAMAPVIWLGYNWLVYRNPLEFANGPYSARAIEQRTARPGYPPHPGSGNLKASGQYFLKSAELNLAEGNWQKFWLLLALVGGGLGTALDRRLAPLLLLWIPLAFYMLSVAYGGVPVFVPSWWPFSYYNVRYGLQLLPAAAVFVALAFYFLATLARPMPSRLGLAVAAFALVTGSYLAVWRHQPVCFREAWVNSRSRLALEAKLADQLRSLPPDSTILMYLGDHVGALQQAGISLRRVINEGNHRTWKQPSDPEGLWENALRNPAQYADYAVAIEGDPVSRALAQHQPILPGIVDIDVDGQPRAVVMKLSSRVPVISPVN
jgi:hypothetical protein